MTPFEVYCDYINLKNHLTKESYDYHKYKGKSRLKPSSFQSRKDRLFFEKIAKHNDPHNFLLSNLIIDGKIYIRDIAYSDQAEKNYKNWLKRQQSLSYSFRQDLTKLKTNFDDNFVCEDHQHPVLLNKYLSEEISLESLCILLDLTKAKKYWDNRLKFDLVYDNIKLKIEKYTPFINYDKDKFTNICLDYFNK